MPLKVSFLLSEVALHRTYEIGITLADFFAVEFWDFSFPLGVLHFCFVLKEETEVAK